MVDVEVVDGGGGGAWVVLGSGAGGAEVVVGAEPYHQVPCSLPTPLSGSKNV